METLNDVLVKRYSKSLVAFMRLVDPERNFAFTDELKTSWDKLTLIEQQRLYLYLLYRKWRGISIYGEPYYIIANCHPVPFNWNGVAGINTLVKQNKMVIAKYNGSYGSYTKDEARIWHMTDVHPLN